MKKQQGLGAAVFAGLAMSLLILDARTALAGAKDGLELSLRTVIPALFPFLFLSNLLCNGIVGRKIVLLRPIGRLCGIPDGAESLLLLGLLGGYPVGAQAVANAYKNGQLKKNTAERMLGFCNNAGPSFLFGMLGAVFANTSVPWLLWLIHILSALLVGMLLPGKEPTTCHIERTAPLPIPKALERSVRTMANICGWIIVFRVLIAISDRWLLWLLPQQVRLGLIGMLELSNGCCELYALPHDGVRFVFASCFLAFGGLCVAMQTSSVSCGLDSGIYIRGKLLQALISFLIAVPAVGYTAVPATLWGAVLACTVLYLIILHRSKKTVAFLPQMLYNSRKC